MSRSRRKTPIYGMTTARSEKRDKQLWHGRMRACERGRLRDARVDFDAHLTTLEREVSNRWAMDKDGRQWWPWWRQALQAEAAHPSAGGPWSEVLHGRQRYLARQRFK